MEHQAEERRAYPSIQLDYCFSKAEGSDSLTTVLIAIDCQSKMIPVHPLPSKGSNLKGQAEHLVRFTMPLSYMDQVEFVSDAEPTMKSLLASVQLLRQHLGYPTVVTHSRPGDKGRTAQVERVIQTLRRQSSTLVQMASDKCGTLNRFANHTTTEMSPFELVYGRRYSGKVAVFEEMVLVLHRRGSNTKLGPQWTPGIWLTKTDGDDLHVVATPNGLVRGKAIRRLNDPWKSTWLFMVQDKPYKQVLSRKATLKNLRFGAPTTPKPVIEKHPTIPEESIAYDIDARDVREYARTHPPSPVSDLGDYDEDGKIKRSAPEEQLSPNKAARHGDTADNVEEPVIDDGAVKEPHGKAPRLSPQGSPSSASGSNLYPPQFAGHIQQVLEIGEVDDEIWENEVADYIGNDDNAAGYDLDGLPADEGKSPTLSPSKLESLDEAAGYKEINRLLEMGVLEGPSLDDLEQGTVLHQGCHGLAFP